MNRGIIDNLKVRCHNTNILLDSNRIHPRLEQIKASLARVKKIFISTDGSSLIITVLKTA
uniref:Uncharacterized protein n=1 Tax=Romanomermis culicivorax TaxID=13658 RepID=A0A915HI55_ROMCU